MPAKGERTMSVAMGPCACQGCGQPVYWTNRWRDAGQRRGRHVCPDDRPACGARMPTHGDRCARTPGHGYEHRSAYAMANARRKGLAA